MTIREMLGRKRQKSSPVALIFILILSFFSCPLHGKSFAMTIDSKDNNGDIVQTYRALYDSGFSRIMALLPESVETSRNKQLFDIKRFKEQHVRWAKLDGSTYIAMDSGSLSGAWLTIIPPGHNLINEQKNVLQIEQNPTLNVLRILPARINELWAGFFLIHELSHLSDRAHKVEPVNPTREEYLNGEARAYRLEMSAVNLYSHDEYLKRLDLILQKWNIDDPKSLVGHILTGKLPEIEELEKAVSEQKPESAQERELRNGFHVLSLFLRYCDIHNVEEKKLLRGLGALLLTSPWPEDSDEKPVINSTKDSSFTKLSNLEFYALKDETILNVYAKDRKRNAEIYSDLINKVKGWEPKVRQSVILSEKFHNEIVQAMKLYDTKRYEDALAILVPVIKEEPYNLFALEKAARTLYALNERKKSFNAYHKLISIIDNMKEEKDDKTIIPVDAWFAEAYWKYGTLLMDTEALDLAAVNISRFLMSMSVTDRSGQIKLFEQALSYLTEAFFYMKKHDIAKYYAQETLKINSGNTYVKKYLDEMK